MSGQHDPSESSVLVNQALGLYESSLIHYATGILHGDEDRARDVAQDTFLRLWQTEPERVRDNLKAWLYTVCRNRCLDILRKDHRLELGNEAALEGACDWRPDPSSRADTHELSDRVWELVESLSPNQREVVRLKFIHDASYKDIARITGLSIGNVGFIMHTAVKKLREMLNRELSEYHHSP
jgi:RNA polymerase sigma-70 factor (ECF subfamily)